MIVHTIADSSTGYFSGHLLIATPALEGCFDRSVIYLCEHNAQGAMGIVVNHPVANIRLSEILKALNINAGRDIGDLPVYFGGPVEAHRGFVLHSNDKLTEDSVVGPDGITLSSNIGLLRAVAEGAGPKQGFLALGYAGWGAGQLEAELEAGSWITVPASRELVFHTDDDLKWSLAGASQGIDMSRVSSVVGHA